MALRLFSKINSTFNSNLPEVFHPRSFVKSVAVFINNDQVEKKENSSNDDENNKTHLLHENIKHKTFDVRARSQLSFPDLQPSSLPEYYNPHQNLDNPLKYIEKPVAESSQSTSKRVFEASTTYKNVKLPLKPPRLAKPFPDPVKTMASDTISDDEKARQMQSDAQYPGNSKSKNFNKMNFNPQYRSFGTKSRGSKRKCKKPKKKKCQRIKSRNCPHARSNCSRSYKFKRCRKQKAPYPSYSEICHTVLDSYPSECQMCPWTPQNHPTFKIKKRKFHTSAITFSPKERDFEKWLHSVDQNRGWVREKKTLQKDEKNNHKRKLSEINENIEIPKSTNQFKLHHKEKFSNKPKKSNVEIEPIIVQKLPSTLNISSKPLFINPGMKTEKDEAIEIKNLKSNCKRRSKSEMLSAVKHKSKAKTVLYNPGKKGKQFDQDWNKEDIPATINITINYFMAKKKDRRFPPGTRDKCPDTDPETDDPCNLKRPGITRECPKDLLIKKRRPIKPPSKKKCYPKKPQKPNNPDQPYF